MNNDIKSFVSQLRTDRNAIIELFIVAGLMSLSVSIIANVVFTRLPECWSVVAGVLGILGCVAYLWGKRFGRREYTHKFTGIVVYDKDSKNLINVRGYELSEKTVRYLRAAFSENLALKTQWEQDPVDKMFDIDLKAGRVSKRDTLAAKLMRELLEYTAIETLSTHLTDYFNSSGLDKAQLKEYRRADIPDILLSNRFLELFSKPMEDRPSFVNRKEAPNFGVTVMAGGPGGAMYSRFDLRLPLGSTVRRGPQGQIEIDGPLVRLNLAPIFDGFSDSIPDMLLERYVGLERKRNVEVYQVGISVSAVVKLRGVFSSSPWLYHKWMESFFTRLERLVSWDAFISRINWDVVETVVRCMTIRAETNLKSKAEDVTPGTPEEAPKMDGQAPNGTTADMANKSSGRPDSGTADQVAATKTDPQSDRH